MANQKIQIFIDAQYPIEFTVEGLRKGQQIEVYDTYGMALCSNWAGDNRTGPLVRVERDVDHPHMPGQGCEQKITISKAAS